MCKVELRRLVTNVSKPSDVYSFSMVMLELLTRERPSESYAHSELLRHIGPSLVPVWALH